MRGSRSPKKILPNTATQSGIIAMSRAAIPDGTVSSPSATIPIPPPISRAPTMNVSRHSRRLGIAMLPRFRTNAKASSTRPASANRVAAMMNGGMDSTAIRMPR
jgi:hypothetical protein